ncbi:hypothetical protein Cgig2_009039 [Carnegiea gigantea]|uniref:Uncharacterized protein n=1 Tax=Carnegiea gigantea TaxID=171969 RepID=A0A9Q1GKL6_9CARY|nr:hypothetical protein Cgig2_009039 [Carnegiea gigantea]
MEFERHFIAPRKPYHREINKALRKQFFMRHEKVYDYLYNMTAKLTTVEQIDHRQQKGRVALLTKNNISNLYRISRQPYIHKIVNSTLEDRKFSDDYKWEDAKLEKKKKAHLVNPLLVFRDSISTSIKGFNGLQKLLLYSFGILFLGQESWEEEDSSFGTDSRRLRVHGEFGEWVCLGSEGSMGKKEE